MKISSIMTVDPLVASKGTTIDEALALMDENRIRHLPVLEQGELAGIISDRDLLEATGWLPARVHACRGPRLALELPTHVGDIVREPVVRVGPDDDVVLAFVECLQRKIGCLPAVQDGALVGIVTEMDLARVYVEGMRDGRLSAADDAPVAEHMTKAPRTVKWDATLALAIEICRASGIRHLPVIGAEGLIGIISDRDLRRALGVGRPANTAIDAIMTREIVSVAPQAPVSEAARIMAERKFSALPVVEQEQVVGILTLSDVLEHCLEAGLGAR
jgi:CBS domain-containing protein